MLDFQAAYEAGNHFDTQNLTAGLWAGIDKPEIMPRVHVTANIGYDLAVTLHSEFREDLDEKETINFGRLSAQGLVQIWLPYLRFEEDEWLVSAEVHGYYQHELSSSLLDNEKDEFNYLRLTLAYELSRPLWEVCRSVFVQYTNGRLPTQLDEERFVWLGLKFVFN